MIRMARLTDYGIMLLTRFAQEPARVMRSARDLSAETKLPLPTVSKLLKMLAHSGLLIAHRGVKGGFSLAKSPTQITLADIVSSLEGQVALTECSEGGASACDLQPTCAVGANLRRISLSFLDALKAITLDEMTRPLPDDLPNVQLRFARSLPARRASP